MLRKHQTMIRKRGSQVESAQNPTDTNSSSTSNRSSWLPILLIIISIPILFWIISSIVSNYNNNNSDNTHPGVSALQKRSKLIKTDGIDNFKKSKTAADNDIDDDNNNISIENNDHTGYLSSLSKDLSNQEIKDISFALDHSIDPIDPHFIDSWKYCHDNCEWRNDNLVGRCFGLWKVKSIDKNKIINKESIFLLDINNNKKSIDNIYECKQLCCDMGNDCVTFQYHPLKGCFVGGNVRLGLERASTGNWCEPKPPKQWLGQRKIKDNNGNVGIGNECIYDESDENELKYQCFGLGPEIRGIKEINKCKEYCCDEGDKCELWQFRDDKGCFTGKSGNCDKDNDAWIGARKTLESVGIEF